MTFLDTLMMPEPDRTLATTSCRKPTHIDQYLQWHNHHNITVKYSVVNTLTHRAKTLCSNPELLKTKI